MKKLASVLVVTLALLLSACGGTPPQPIDVITPAPWPGGTSATPQTTPSTEPTQEELSAQAEQAYRAFFNEWKRLQFAGGADEPTQVMRNTAGPEYLEGVMKLLRDQRVNQITVTGDFPTTTVVAAPGGDFEGMDPRLTLMVCEDHSNLESHEDGLSRTGDTLEGTVYLDFIDGRPKVVGGVTRPVEVCSI